MWSATIRADSQAAILMTRHSRGMLCHYLVGSFHEEMAKIRHRLPRIELELRWTLGYGGIAGNEQADEEAKKAGSPG